jgi:hypothetical protein
VWFRVRCSRGEGASHILRRIACRLWFRRRTGNRVCQRRAAIFTKLLTGRGVASAFRAAHQLTTRAEICHLIITMSESGLLGGWESESEPHPEPCLKSAKNSGTMRLFCITCPRGLPPARCFMPRKTEKKEGHGISPSTMPSGGNLLILLRNPRAVIHVG